MLTCQFASNLDANSPSHPELVFRPHHSTFVPVASTWHYVTPGTTTWACPPRRHLGRGGVQTDAALRPILGPMHPSNPRPRTRSIASVVAVHVRAPVSPPLSLCTAARTPLADAHYYTSRARAIAAPIGAMVWPWRPLDCVRRPGSAVPATRFGLI